MQAQVRVLEAQQAQVQAQAQTQTPQQPQTGQTQPQQPTVQVQTHNPPQPSTQPLVAAVQLTNGASASPPPQQAASSGSGTPVSVSGNSSGSTNGNGGAVSQRPTPNQEATATSPPLDPETAAVMTSIGARPVASYYNAMQTLQSMFEVNEGVTVSLNANGSAQTRFQATPQVRGPFVNYFCYKVTNIFSGSASSANTALPFTKPCARGHISPVTMKESG